MVNKKSLILVSLLLLIGLGIGWFAFKTKEADTQKKLVTVEAEKEKIFQEPVNDNLVVPLKKRTYADGRKAFYDLHGRFVELKPLGEKDKSLWQGVLRLEGGKLKVKVILGIAAPSQPKIAFAKYENNWYGSSSQVFDDLSRVLDNLVKVGDEVVVRVSFNFGNQMTPQAMKKNLEAMKQLDELAKKWQEIKDQDKTLDLMLYAERVGIVL